jgi:leucine dehydrogenase
MPVFAHPEYAGHERIVFCSDADSGLAAIIAIHSTALGPAAGGCRMHPYRSAEQALTDVLRLSRAMTLKNALAGLPLGGGKSVIIADPQDRRKPERLEAFGRHIQAQAGSYWTAEDVGVGVDDLAAIAKHTCYVFGTRDGIGDPSPFTARGVLQGLKAAVRFRLGTDSLRGLRVAVQGLGAVGWKLAEMVKAEGAMLVVADRDARLALRAVRDLGAETVPADDIHKLAADVFAPCAMGGILGAQSIPELQCAIVAGAANNQLARASDGIALAARDILYVPDFLLNAGGMLAVGPQIYQSEDVDIASVDRIFDTATEVFRGAKAEGVTPEIMAERIAQRRIDAATSIAR